MKQMKLLAGTLGVAAALAAQSAFGAGFGIYEGSARGNAMGTEVTADPASPSVLYNNAAGMTELEGTQIEAGVTLINPAVTVVTATPAGTAATEADSNWWTPPSAYVTHQINEKLWLGHFELWDEGEIIFRHGMALMTGEQPSLAQAAAMIDVAVEAADRFFPAFDFLLRGAKTPQEAIAACMFETVGEA